MPAERRRPRPWPTERLEPRPRPRGEGRLSLESDRLGDTPAVGHRAAVLGDLVLDCVLLPAEPLRHGTDVAGEVRFRQGGSAATTARWLARRGVAAILVTAVGADRLGADLVAWLQSGGVTVEAVTVHGAATGRLGVIVDPAGERTFVADRGAILALGPRRLRAAWFARAELLHLPGYSLLSEPLAAAADRAARWAAGGGAAISVDLASAGFLDRFGPRAMLDRVAALGPAVILATEAEAATALGGAPPERLLELAPLVVLKAGPAGATALRRSGRPVIEVARRIQVRDSTGAGDAFDGGFLAAWLQGWPGPFPGSSRSGRSGRPAAAFGPESGGPARPLSVAELRRCLRSGHAAASTELRESRSRPDPTGWLTRPPSAR